MRKTLLVLVSLTLMLATAAAGQTLPGEIVEDGGHTHLLPYNDPVIWKSGDLALSITAIGKTRGCGDGALVLRTQIDAPEDDWRIQGSRLQANGKSVNCDYTTGIGPDAPVDLVFGFSPSNPPSLKNLTGKLVQAGDKRKQSFGPYGIDELKKTVVIPDAQTVVQLADWLIDDVPVTYVDLYTTAEQGNGHFSAAGSDEQAGRPGARYLALRFFLVTPDGEYEIATAVRGNDGKRVDMWTSTSTYWNAKDRTDFHDEDYYGLSLTDAGRDDKSDGMKVFALDPHGPAQKAGVKVGDTVVEVNGRKLSGPTDLWMGTSGRKMSLKLVRDGKKISVGIQPVPDPLWAGMTKAEEPWKPLLARYKWGGNPQAMLFRAMSDDVVAQGFKPAKVELTITRRGEPKRTVEFKIPEIPVPSGFWAIKLPPLPE